MWKYSRMNTQDKIKKLNAHIEKLYNTSDWHLRIEDIKQIEYLKAFYMTQLSRQLEQEFR